MSLINNPPLAESLVDSKDATSRAWTIWFMQVFRACFDVQNSGTTAQRPTAHLYVGKFYFDTTLGYPIWLGSLGPAVWVDATGASV